MNFQSTLVCRRLELPPNILAALLVPPVSSSATIQYADTCMIPSYVYDQHKHSQARVRCMCAVDEYAREIFCRRVRRLCVYVYGSLCLCSSPFSVMRVHLNIYEFLDDIQHERGVHRIVSSRFILPSAIVFFFSFFI